MIKIVDRIREAVGGLLDKDKIELVDLIYRREASGMVLRFLVDKEGGITLGECARLNEEIGRRIEEQDIIQERYILEVSSPGLDRQLKTRRDFERVMGKKIRVHTFEPIIGRMRDYEGVVMSADDEKVTVGDVVIRLDRISKARLKVEFR